MLDQSGKPIAGARIEPVSLSINYESMTTNEEGMASIPWMPQKVEWLNVTKKGHRPQKGAPTSTPLLVRLPAFLVNEVIPDEAETGTLNIRSRDFDL